MKKKPTSETVIRRRGKRDLIQKFVEHGFSRDDALRAYDATATFFQEGIDAGNTIIFQRVFKIEARHRAGRVFSDNLHGNKIYYGARIGHVFKRLGKSKHKSTPIKTVYEIPENPPPPESR